MKDYFSTFLLDCEDRITNLSLIPSNFVLNSISKLSTFFLFLTISASIASAATFTVTTLADNQSNGCGIGQCTLREAVNDANLLPGSDTINFQAALTGTIVLTNGHLSITSDITINGPSARTLSVSGNSNSRVFVVSGSGNVANISGLTITGGNAQPILFGATLIGDGGGILNANGATLNLSNVSVSGNSATSLGGGVATRAILLVTTRTNITNSLISNNSAILGGGGISNLGTELLSGAITTISNSTITNNSATAEGGGISNTAATLNLTNTTISHNQSTVAGGGIVNVAGIVVGEVRMRNTILAQNNALVGLNLISSDGLGVFNSLGNNLIGNNLDIGVNFAASVVIGGIAQPNVNADIVGSVSAVFQIVNPLLGNLADNGGQTNTRALLGASPALDRGNNCVVANNCASNPDNNNPSAALTTDQRGGIFSRSIDGNGDSVAIVDIGAYESQFVPTATTFTVTNLNDTPPNGCSVADCTLREAIIAANTTPGTDIINFTPGLNGTIPLNISLGQLEVTSSVSINGPGARNIAVSGEDHSRVLLVGGVGNVATVRGLTLTNGNAQILGTLLGDGGGVLNVGGSTLNLIEMNISGNNATSLGGGIATRSLLGTTSTTYITRSLISDNQSTLGGGGISNIAVLNIVSSATTSVTNSTITLNNTVAEAGGLSNLGGTVNLVNNTISDNSSTATGGGVVNVAGVLGLGVTNVRNTIIARNNAVIVGGILTLSDDVLGIFNSLGNNLIGHNLNAAVSFQASVFVGVNPVPNVNGDIVGSVSVGTTVIDPRLGALQNNGGLTNMRAVLAGSPAIDRGNVCVQTDSCVTDPSVNTLPEALTTDQRGTGFLRVVNLLPEIGAYEIQLQPTAANVSVAGQVTDANGTGITRVRVTLTDMSGIAHTATTNAFGYFQFSEIPSGETYVVTAFHKSHTFSSQIINLNEEMLDLNLTPVQNKFGNK